MRLIGWAIALAAAGLTPAAAQAPASAPAQNARRRAATMPRRPPAPRRTPASPMRRSRATVVPAASAMRCPTPGIGEPDGRKGIQDQVTPIGQEALGFHDNWLLPLCAIISAVVLASCWSVALVRFRRGANPTPSRNSHNTVIEVIWTLVPVLILVGIAIPSIRLLRHTIFAAARRPDGQGHRPPMVLVLRAARLWRSASTATC